MTGSLEPPLSAEGLQVRLGTAAVLHDVSLDVGPGWTAIVGPNGAGKSTLLRVLAGLQSPERGEVRLQGRSLARWSARERARRIAWLAQQGPAEGDLTVREVVRLGRLPHLGLFGEAGRADEAIVDAAMRDAECDAWPLRTLAQLSGGERQRCLLARAIAVGAPILLLDEPTAHLDPPHQIAVVRLLRRLAERATVASVLHDLSLALQADRIVALRDGRIAAAGASDDAALHAALVDVFDGAIRIRAIDGCFVALPSLD